MFNLIKKKSRSRKTYNAYKDIERGHIDVYYKQKRKRTKYAKADEIFKTDGSLKK